MTVRITIKHENPEAAHAILVALEQGGERRIEPGQAGEFYIYDGTGLAVSEVALETAQEPAPLQSFSLAAIGQGVTGDEPTEPPAAEETVHNINTTTSLELSALQPVQAEHAVLVAPAVATTPVVE